MDNAANRHVQDLIEAINLAVARDPMVQECRTRARAEGFELHVTLEAVLSQAGRQASSARVRPMAPPSRQLPAAPAQAMSAADRRFLRSLRIAAGEPEEV
jgi:hypothetical protein